MNNIVITINILSNGFAIPGIIKCYTHKDGLGLILTVCSFLTSCLMHITETKHDIIPLCFEEYSKIFLITDNVLILAIVLYGIYNMKRFPNEIILETSAIFYIGILALFLGEKSSDLLFYLISHTIWHYCLFKSLYNIL